MSATCEGAAKWQIFDAQGNRVAHGTAPCNNCTSSALFSYQAGAAPLGTGTYTVQAEFDRGHGVDSTPTSSFTVADATGTAAILSSSASVVALALLVRRRDSGRQL